MKQIIYNTIRHPDCCIFFLNYIPKTGRKVFTERTSLLTLEKAKSIYVIILHWNTPWHCGTWDDPAESCAHPGVQLCGNSCRGLSYKVCWRIQAHSHMESWKIKERDASFYRRGCLPIHIVLYCYMYIFWVFTLGSAALNWSLVSYNHTLTSLKN